MVNIVRTLAEQAKSLANYLPGGDVFASKNDPTAVTGQFVTALANELFRVDEDIRLYRQNIIPDETILFIDEWEKALGIPDDCFDGLGDIDTRRNRVLVKLASLGVQTDEDFVALALLFGHVVTVTQGASKFGIIITFTVVINNAFPLTFPFKFGDQTIGILECLFLKLRPANCIVTFVQI